MFLPSTQTRNLDLETFDRSDTNKTLTGLHSAQTADCSLSEMAHHMPFMEYYWNSHALENSAYLRGRTNLLIALGPSCHVSNQGEGHETAVLKSSRCQPHFLLASFS